MGAVGSGSGLVLGCGCGGVGGTGIAVFVAFGSGGGGVFVAGSVSEGFNRSNVWRALNTIYTHQLPLFFSQPRDCTVGCQYPVPLVRPRDY